MLFWLGVVVLISTSCIFIEVFRGSQKICTLAEIDPVPTDQAPEASIIVAARNEERNIRTALQSLLNSSYPQLQIIVVNDRSEDNTAAILSELAASDPRLTIINIDNLPSGWLGKNHALWRGAEKATGEFLLFTDADVVMSPDTLQRAMGYVRREKLDHLAATPEAKMPSLFLNSFGITFGIFFSLFTRPWKAREPGSRWHIGIGAFNLVRAEAYHQTGGHKAIALRPDDDLKLGKIIKSAGYRQDLVNGRGMISVEWYASVRELILGLEKNIYAGTDYRLWFAASGVLFNLLVFVWPYIALFFSTGSTLALYATSVTLLSLLFADSARQYGLSPWYTFAFPFTTTLFLFIIVRTLVVNLGKGGINWRGTFYSLKELRKNRV